MSAKPKRPAVRDYAIGYGVALALTLAAFAIVHWGLVSAASAFDVVLCLALAQALVHFRFFFHISAARSARNELWLLLFAALIIALMAAGTLVILANLRHRMM